MTIIWMTKKNGVFLHQFISSMNECWILAHSSCFVTLQFSANCRAGVGRSSRISLHQRRRKVAVQIPPSLYGKATPLGQEYNTSALKQEHQASLEIPLFHFKWSLKMGNLSGKRPKLSCLIHESIPMNHAHFFMSLSIHSHGNKRWSKAANDFSSQPFHLALFPIGLLVTIGFFCKKFPHCTWVLAINAELG